MRRARRRSARARRCRTARTVARRTTAAAVAVGIVLSGSGVATASAPPEPSAAAGDLAVAADALAAILDDDTEPRADDGVFERCPLGDPDELVAIVDDLHGVRRDVRNDGQDYSLAYLATEAAGDAVTCIRSLQVGEESGVPYGEVAVWAGFRSGDDYDAELEGGYVSIVIDAPTELADAVVYTYCWYATAEFTLCGADWVPADSEVVIGVWVGGFRGDAPALAATVEVVVDAVLAALGEVAAAN